MPGVAARSAYLSCDAGCGGSAASVVFPMPNTGAALGAAIRRDQELRHANGSFERAVCVARTEGGLVSCLGKQNEVARQQRTRATTLIQTSDCVQMFPSFVPKPRSYAC